MATIYFTSNADSGSGTLRDAINSAESGDTITYDPSVFTTGPVVISLSSYLPILPENATLDGGSLGIVLDGQNNSMSGYSAVRGTGTLTVINLTVKRYKVTTNSPIFVNTASSTYVFKRCKFVDNTGVWYGVMRVNKGAIELYDCLLTGNQATGSNSTHGGLSVNTDGTATAIAVRSTICGNVYGNVSGTSHLTRSGTFIGLTPPEIDGTAPEEIGFVNPPPSAAIPKGEYTEGDWESWDFRLKPTSPYLTGASYQAGDKDLLGHDRTGSWGCYDGSWLVVPANGTATISSDTTVDYAEIGSGATVNFTNANLTVTKNADIDTSTFASSSTAYLAVPSGTYFNLSTFTNVVHCTYGGGVTAVSGSVDLRTCTFSVTKTGTETVDCIEYRTEEDTSWSKIVNLTDSSTTFSTVTDKGFYLRAYDGVNFVTSSWIPRTYYYKGNATSGSFTTSSDWAMNAQKTLTCNAAPSIKEGTFHCE